MDGYFVLIAKSHTTIGVPVGVRTEIPQELWADKAAVEAVVRDSLAWYAEQEHAEIIGNIRWSLALCGNSFAPPIEEGVWE